jgi:hypothetical protein
MMGKETQNSVGNQVAIGKVSKVKRWVHPYNELYNFFLIEHRKKLSLFVYAMAKHQFDGSNGVSTCVLWPMGELSI